MLSISSFYSPLHSRSVRILGPAPNGLLVATYQKGSTSIQLIRRNSAFTVISFKQNMDIINASLSEDNELIHVTERVMSRDRRIIFKSIIHSIHSFMQYHGDYYMEPIAGVFYGPPKQLAGGRSDCRYNLLIFSQGNSSLSHFAVDVGSKKLVRKQMRSLPNVRWFDVAQREALCYALQENRSNYVFSEYQLTNDGLMLSKSFKIRVTESAFLPSEFALMPNEDVKSPIYGSSHYKMYCTKHEKKLFVFYQVFNEDSFCSFSITELQSAYTEDVVIENVPPDIPICFLKFSTLVFIFAPNSFICVVDISQKVPLIKIFPKQFAALNCGVCAISLPLENHIIDIDSNQIYYVTVCFQSPQFFSQFMDSETYNVFALICSKLLNFQNMFLVFDIIERTKNGFYESKFFKEFISVYSPNQSKGLYRSKSLDLIKFVRCPKIILDELNEIEKEFPSASQQTRKETFKRRMKSLRTTENNFKKEISVLKKQNGISLFLKSVFEEWTKTSNPSFFWKFRIGFSLLNETIFADFPSVQNLKNEVQTISDEVISPTMKQFFIYEGIFDTNLLYDNHQEIRYWNARFETNSSLLTDYIKNEQSPLDSIFLDEI